MNFNSPLVEECDSILYTEHGELRFCEKPKPKFVFFNSRAKKPELVCYSSTIRAIANNLHEAQAAARSYLVKLKEKSESSVVEESAETTGKCTEEGSTDSINGKNDEIIFCKLLSYYGKEIEMRNYLLVNVYNERPRIWLKPWWRDMTTQPIGEWLPSMAGFQFSFSDSARDLVTFENKCTIKSRKEMREKEQETEMPTVVDLIPSDPEFDNLVVQHLEMEEQIDMDTTTTTREVKQPRKKNAAVAVDNEEIKPITTTTTTPEDMSKQPRKKNAAVVVDNEEVEQLSKKRRVSRKKNE
jgi:predicted transcriptional regulator